MSDEFIAVATKEINEEITGISDILSLCSDDVSLSENSTDLQKHTHKIKGLSPMMGKDSLGNLTSLFDDVLKQILSGKSFPGFFKIFNDSIPEMKNSMAETDYELNSIIEKTNNLLSSR